MKMKTDELPQKIKAVSKFSNVIDYHQPEKVRTRHTCVIAKCTSCPQAVVVHFADLTFVFIHKKSITNG